MNLIRSLRPLRYFLEGIFFQRTKNPRVLNKLKDQAKRKPLLVIGNGPSLKKTPLDELQHVTSIGMNKINLLFPHVKWRPNLIVCLNRHVMKQNQEFFANTDIPVFQSWQSRWFVDREYRGRAVYFLNFSSGRFSTDITSGVGIGGTVTYTALQFAYYMGANPVILFGVDHSFRYTGAANELVISSSNDVNHFDPNYFGNGVKWNLPDLEESESAYLHAKYAFEEDGRVVYDATVDGKLDIFPKIDLTRVTEICKD